MFPNTPGPILTPNPQAGPPTNHHKKLVLIGVALVVGIALIAGILYVLTRTPLKDSLPFFGYDSMQAVTPKDTLRVADNRYVGACRALPPEVVQQAVKPFEKATSYTEEFYAQPPAEATVQNLSGARSACRYLYVDADNTSLDLELQQFASAETAKQKWETQRKLGNGEYRKEFLEGATGGDGSALDEAFKSIVNEQDLAALEARSGGVTLNGLNPNILYVAGDGKLVSYRKNIKISLDYAFGGAASTDGSLQLSKQEAETKIAAIKQIFDTVYKNIDDQKLSQAPQRSIPSNKKEVYGARVVEPCGLLTSDLFTQTTGKTVNDTTTSKSAAQDLTRTSKNRAGQILYPNTSCERSYLGEFKRGTVDRDSATMNVKLVYTPNADEAKAYVNREVDNLFTLDVDTAKSPKELGLDLVLSKPESAADLTYIFDTTKLRELKPETALVKKAFFATGSYAVIVDVRMEATDRTPKAYPVEDGVYLSAIHRMVEKLREIN